VADTNGVIISASRFGSLADKFDIDTHSMTTGPAELTYPVGEKTAPSSHRDICEEPTAKEVAADAIK